VMTLSPSVFESRGFVLPGQQVYSGSELREVVGFSEIYQIFCCQCPKFSKVRFASDPLLTPLNRSDM
jgi:hypothetical protein